MSGVNKKGQDMKSKISSVSFSNRKAQMQISFGTIFSIILIIIFIVFAVYGISKFLSTVNYGKVQKFKNDFQDNINSMWQSTRGSQEYQYILPKKVQAVCFREEDSQMYMYFMPRDLAYEGTYLSHIDVSRTLGVLGSNLCISVSDSELSLVIDKTDYSENLVRIKRASV